MGANYMGPSPTEENLRWELQQAKIRIEQLEAEVYALEAQVDSLHYQLSLYYQPEP